MSNKISSVSSTVVESKTKIQAERNYVHENRLVLCPEISVAFNNLPNRSVFQRVKDYFNSVRVTIGNGKDRQNLELNISSVSKRLGISRSLVKRIATKENSCEIFANIADRRAKNIFRELARIKEKFGVDKGGNLQGLNISPRVLEKALEKRVEVLNQKSNQLKTFKIGDHRFFLGTPKKGEHSFYVSKRLGSGSFGHVYKITCLKTQKTTGLKKARKKDLFLRQPDCEPARDLIREQKVLRALNPKGLLEGLPSPSYDQDIKGAAKIELYSEDLRKAATRLSKQPLEKRLELCRQLLSGLKSMHEKKYIHGDIKPENCLIKYSDEGVPEKCVLNDFGGSREILRGMGKPTSTQNFIPPDDFRNVWDGLKYQSRDVYALSKTLIEVIIDQHLNNQLITGKNKNEDEIKQLLVNAGIPENLALILMSGMRPHGQRPTSEQLYDAFVAGCTG